MAFGDAEKQNIDVKKDNVQAKLVGSTLIDRSSRYRPWKSEIEVFGETIDYSSLVVSDATDILRFDVNKQTGKTMMDRDVAVLFEELSNRLAWKEFVEKSVEKNKDEWLVASADADREVMELFDGMCERGTKVGLATMKLPDGNLLKIYSVGGVGWEKEQKTMLEVIEEYKYLENALEIKSPANKTLLVFDWMELQSQALIQDNFETEIAEKMGFNGLGLEKFVLLLNQGEKKTDGNVEVKSWRRRDVMRHEIGHWMLKVCDLDIGKGTRAQVEGFMRMCQYRFNLKEVKDELTLQARADPESELYKNWITKDYIQNIFSLKNEHLGIADVYDASGSFYCYLYERFNREDIGKGAEAVKRFYTLITGNLNSRYSKYEEWSEGDLLKTLAGVAKGCGWENFDENDFLDGYVEAMEWKRS